MIRFLILWIASLQTLFASNAFHDENPYDFKGKHFIASYLDCDPLAIANLKNLIQAMDDAVIASGATILDRNHYIFEPNGITMIYLLSESHASIHTYPEHGACFVDLFTCGDSCSEEAFDLALRAYLCPKEVNRRTFLRSDVIEEIATH